MTKGFTLLELIIILAIVSTFLALGFSSLQRFRERLALQQAQQLVVSTLNRARSDSRKLSIRQEVSWTESSLTVEPDIGAVRTIDVSLGGSVKLCQDANVSKIIYGAPYGRTSAAGSKFFLINHRQNCNDFDTLTNSDTPLLKVYVYGVTGKAIASR